MIPDTFRRLLEARGPSGYEQRVSAVFREACEPFAQVSHDTVGSTAARVAGTAGGRSLALVAHSDEIGFVVNHVDDDGFLWFRPVGGWDPQVVIGQRVIVDAREGAVPGVIGRKPIHLLKEDARKEAVKLKDVAIDIGARDRDEALGRVRVGDPVTIDADPLELPNGRVVARAVDNRVGCFVVAEAARRVAELGGAPGDVIAVAASQEEIGFGGSTTTAYSLRPDVAIAVDTTWATDQPGVEERTEGSHRLGSGPVISRGSTLDPLLFELLHDAAEQEGIPFTIDATGRATGTDGDALHRSRGGIPTGVVCLALRYLHHPVEMVDLADVEATVKLLVAVAQRLTGDVDFRR